MCGNSIPKFTRSVNCCQQDQCDNVRQIEHIAGHAEYLKGSARLRFRCATRCTKAAGAPVEFGGQQVRPAQAAPDPLPIVVPVDDLDQRPVVQPEGAKVEPVQPAQALLPVQSVATEGEPDDGCGVGIYSPRSVLDVRCSLFDVRPPSSRFAFRTSNFEVGTQGIVLSSYP